MTRSRSFFVAFLGIRLLALVLLLALVCGGSACRRLAPEPKKGEAGATYNSGSWEIDLEGMAPPESQERARELSLPYSSGSAPVPEASGVRHHDAELAQEGVNLYVSGHGPEAILVGMKGEALHRWRMPFERAFPGRRPTGQPGNWRRAWLLPDGSLLAIFQAAGLVKMDRDSRRVWAHPWVFYNHVSVDSRGRIHSLTKEARSFDDIHDGREVLEDFVVVLGPDGELLSKVSLLDALRRSEYSELLSELVDGSDILHSNTVFRLEQVGEAPPGVRAGQLLISLRELDLVGVLDLEEKRFVWALRGGWRRQHQPLLLPSGELMLFDNRGYRTPGQRPGARILRVDLRTGDPSSQIPAPGQPPLRSWEAGSCQLLANGNVLITESERGRALEVDPEGRIVWEFVSPHRSGDRNHFVATLFEVVRLPRPEWLSKTPGGPSPFRHR